MTNMTSLLTTLALICLVSFPSAAVGSVISFQSSASSIKPLITSNFTLRCALQDTSGGSSVVGRSVNDVTDGQDSNIDLEHLDDLDDDTMSSNSLTQTTENMAFVNSIMISRDGVDLATVTEHFAARPVGGASGFQVSGHIPGTSGDKGELQLVWPHPTQTESGSYECNIATLTSQGKDFHFSQSVEVTEDDVSLSDLVSEIHQLKLDKEQADVDVKMMNTTIANLAKSDVEMRATIANQTKSDVEMRATIANQAKSDVEMRATIANQAKTIDNLIKSEEKLKTDNAALNLTLEALRQTARVEPNVFFSAALSSPKTISSGHGVVYDKVFVNQGTSYNSGTGKFTAPVDGFYHFEVHAYSTDGKHAYLKLRRNGNDVIGLVNYDDDNGYTGATNSVTLRLAKGDTINVVGYYITSHLYSQSSGAYMYVNAFSGHLLALD